MKRGSGGYLLPEAYPYPTLWITGHLLPLCRYFFIKCILNHSCQPISLHTLAPSYSVVVCTFSLSVNINVIVKW